MSALCQGPLAGWETRPWNLLSINMLTSIHQIDSIMQMRATLTSDDDVSSRLERERRKRHIAFKAMMNEVLRAGLDALQPTPHRRERFSTKGFDLGPSMIGSSTTSRRFYPRRG